VIAELFQAETLRLFVVLAFFAAGAWYVMRCPPRAALSHVEKDADTMASKIAALTAENVTLRQEVTRLEYTVDKVLEENRRLRERVDSLTVQVADLTTKMHAAQQLAEEWQQTARDWHSAARAQKEP